MSHLHSTPLSDLPLVFIDLETTGLNPQFGHRICEVAMLRERAGREEGQLDALLNPGRPLDPKAAAVNGLNDAQLANAPPFASVAPSVVELSTAAVAVGHNLAFDLAFLNHELVALGQPRLNEPSLDTLILARRLLRCQSYNLTALCSELGLLRPSHRAMADVLAMRALFHHLRELMAAQGITTLTAALRFERGLRPDDPEPEPPPLIAAALATQRPLRIIYSSRSTPEPTARIIYPHYLTQERNGTYLRAFCELRQDVRTFALAKIQHMELLEG
ncbi:exonuclease domain-containing protein [Candidatus Viridilinea mediisalina]|uniref:DNA polymerase III subunit epsilon n=1 Tax=Candidatus Viridilinea mediisalina TaxID=2024553 RepID=A0A2A6RNU1_9CHLR|nr:exonuclease domain-containing protein [Candidatus Viridilinea mediisalina]PDW04605.1 DNA polymerase III subunit epsilon [Candidatus Viridilinea mediisalina]